MIIRNFYDERLSQASYLVGCARTGTAIVIDPLRDIRQYVEMAAAQGLKIIAVTETHIHADFLSGARQLAAATGADIYLSDAGGPDWQYGYAHVSLRDADIIRIGNLSLRVIHTPGHTPEHIAFLLTDHPTGEMPHSLFTGDFVFVGDMGRPDLLERAAKIEGTMEAGARTLYRSLQTLRQMADSLLLWPGHGSGSSCGKSLGGSPVTSLGYERQTNWAFQCKTEDEFVEEVLMGQPEPPTYFAMMKRLNKSGPAILDAAVDVPRSPNPTGRLVDVRSSSELRTGYFPTAIAIPSGRSFANWAGWLLAYDEPVTLIASSQDRANQARDDMFLIGLDVVSSWMPPSEVQGANAIGVPCIQCSELQPNDFVLDIRSTREWNEGHVARAFHAPLGYLSQTLDSIPRDRRIAVHCAAGGRSPIGVSILLGAGFRNVAEIPGGFTQVEQNCPGLTGT